MFTLYDTEDGEPLYTVYENRRNTEGPIGSKSADEAVLTYDAKTARSRPMTWTRGSTTVTLTVVISSNPDVPVAVEPTADVSGRPLDGP